MKVIMTTLFGIEAVTARELVDLGYAREQVQVSDGQLSLDTGPDLAEAALAVARLNINLATAERVLLQLATFKAESFDELFDRTGEQPWEDWIPVDFAFHIKGYSRKSKLFGVPACQSLVKKAIVQRLLAARGLAPDSQLVEDRQLGLVRIQFSIIADQVTLMVDTSGEGLHKRGYRPLRSQAPIKETLAAAIIRLARFRPFSPEALLDPMCGSGTFPIEAALMAAGIAPGLNREFAAENWPPIGPDPFARAREEASGKIDREAPDQPFIFASDLSAKEMANARQNAQTAGVDAWISFSRRDAASWAGPQLARRTGTERQLVICNPPYGERMLDERQANALYRMLGEVFLDKGRPRPDVRFFMITPYEGLEELLGQPATRRRKLYNGMIKCTLYQYFGQRSKKK